MANKITPQKIAAIQHKTGKKLTLRQRKLLMELPRAKTLAEAGRRAGYTGKYVSQSVNKALNNGLQEYIDGLGIVGLTTLEEVATTGRNEIARVNAATKLVEQAYGKPKEQSQAQSNIAIIINKI